MALKRFRQSRGYRRARRVLVVCVIATAIRNGYAQPTMPQPTGVVMRLGVWPCAHGCWYADAPDTYRPRASESGILATYWPDVTAYALDVNCRTIGRDCA